MENLRSRIKKLKDYENLKEILGEDLGSALYELVDSDECCYLKYELDVAHTLINELYESGCLDIEREELVQAWIKT